MGSLFLSKEESKRRKREAKLKLFEVLVTHHEAQTYQVWALNEGEARDIFTEGNCIYSNTVHFEAEEVKEIKNDHT